MGGSRMSFCKSMWSSWTVSPLLAASGDGRGRGWQTALKWGDLWTSGHACESVHLWREKWWLLPLLLWLHKYHFKGWLLLSFAFSPSPNSNITIKSKNPQVHVSMTLHYSRASYVVSGFHMQTPPHTHSTPQHHPYTVRVGRWWRSIC